MKSVGKGRNESAGIEYQGENVSMGVSGVPEGEIVAT